MAFIELNVYSQALGTQQQIYVIIPQKNTFGEIGTNNSKPKENEKFKCLYLLHGLSDNHTIWLRRTSIERYATELGLCIVMPCGDRSFYTDMVHGGKYYTYISCELPSIICETFNVSNKREDNFIAGLSMGGYGALKIGLKNCDKFSAIAGLSSVADIIDAKRLFPDDFKNIWGEDMNIPKEDDLFYLAEEVDKNPLKPRVFTWVGTEDFLYQANVKLKEKFLSLNYDYTYEESEGAHGWKYWDLKIQNVLNWLNVK